MEVTNLIDIRSRKELYEWYLANHDTATHFWVRVNRGSKEVEGVVSYIDAVECALCFGWIDSTTKKIDDRFPVQRFSPRRKGCYWTEQNKERCRRLIKLGEMTPAGEAVLPDMSPDSFQIEPWVLEQLQKDKSVWEQLMKFPETYRRIKLYSIQYYSMTGRHEEALAKLQRFMELTRKGKMSPGWRTIETVHNENRPHWTVRQRPRKGKDVL